MIKATAAKNITFMNVTYDTEWFNTHNITENNPLAAQKTLERKERIENYSLSLNNSIEASDLIYKEY